MLSCSTLPCQPALDGHAIDLGIRSGFKNPVWGYCSNTLFGDRALDGDQLTNYSRIALLRWNCQRFIQAPRSRQGVALTLRTPSQLIYELGSRCPSWPRCSPSWPRRCASWPRCS
eukprot:2373154-Pyramimonas_sp.AAC.1